MKFEVGKIYQHNLRMSELPSSHPETNCSEIPNNWIPCTPETMPKDGQIVLITQCYSWKEFEDGNDVTIAQYKNKHFTWYRYQKDWDKHTSIMNHGDICPGIEYVTAWMPLPEPYQPKEE